VEILPNQILGLVDKFLCRVAR